jgi:hypothetical protein
MTTRSDRLLEIYFADHLAASTAGLELARRSARSNAGNATGEFLRRLVVEIEEERETLERLMTQLGLKPSRPKVVAAWVAEKVGRLKLNGQVRGYSPLSRVLELESLAVGIAGKEALWKALRRVAAVDTVDLEELIGRAHRQRAEAEEHRLAAVDEAFR